MGSDCEAVIPLDGLSVIVTALALLFKLYGAGLTGGEA